jgi:hypothetical protein
MRGGQTVTLWQGLMWHFGTSLPSSTGIIDFLVSYDSEVCTGARCKIERTSESAH